MPGGEAFSAFQRNELNKVIDDAERLSGHRFAVHVGASTSDPRSCALELHAELADPPNSILIHVDPQLRALEIVTGAAVRPHLSNRQAAFAAINMQSAFATGDLERGIRAGIQQLAHLSKPVPSLHTDTP